MILENIHMAGVSALAKPCQYGLDMRLPVGGHQEALGGEGDRLKNGVALPLAFFGPPVLGEVCGDADLTRYHPVVVLDRCQRVKYRQPFAITPSNQNVARPIVSLLQGGGHGSNFLRCDR